MPSFDVVSQVNWAEVTNAVDQANREIKNRYDFKGSDARVERNESQLVVFADDEFKLGQAVDILHAKLAKRKVDLGSLQAGSVQTIGGDKARQDITVRHGIEQDLAKKIVKLIKDSKLKTQASVQGEQVRVTGKKRDDLQQTISLLRETQLGLPLQFVNFRD